MLNMVILCRLCDLTNTCPSAPHFHEAGFREIIKNGSVCVDGVPVTAPEQKLDSDTAQVTLDGKPGKI